MFDIGVRYDIAMTRLVLTSIAILCMASAVTRGQSAAAPSALGAQAPVLVDAQLKGLYLSIKRSLTQLADRMPADQFNFQPTPDVRTFAAAVAHTAWTNFGVCANLTGQPNPIKDVELEKTATTKAEVTKALADSFTFCDGYVATLSPTTIDRTYEATWVGRDGQRRPVTAQRAGLFAALIAHGNEMYGYMSVYLRLKGLVPPASEPSGPGRGRGGAGGRG
jgi:hypothetical protein